MTAVYAVFLVLAGIELVSGLWTRRAGGMLIVGSADKSASPKAYWILIAIWAALTIAALGRLFKA